VLKKFFVGSGAFQVDFFGGCGVDEYPIRLDVSISVSSPIEFEGMVFVLR